MITCLDFKFRKKTYFLFVLMLCLFIILEVDIRKNQSSIDLYLGHNMLLFLDVKKNISITGCKFTISHLIIRI